MKWKYLITFVLVFLFTFTGCSDDAGTSIQSSSSPESSQEHASSLDAELRTEFIGSSEAQIYLYGEIHSEKKILEKELEIWFSHYQDQKMRHLFIEIPYYGAEILNLWMQSDNDDLLYSLYEGWGDGAAMHTLAVLEFYKQIKLQCPETVFHGTDVGHDRNTNGKWYLEYLKANNLEDTEQYRLALEAMKQGKQYNADGAKDHVYRENTMVENFIRELNGLEGESVMGIYGGAHTNFDALDYETQTVPCMAAQLKERFADTIHAEDLTWVLRDIEPIRVDTIKVGDQEYEAAYYGQQDLSWHETMKYRDVWRLEDAYDDFKDSPLAGDYLPHDNYPMLVDVGQVLILDYTLKDGATVRMYYRSDGNALEGNPITEQFIVE